jgi:hypothetical protein
MVGNLSDMVLVNVNVGDVEQGVVAAQWLYNIGFTKVVNQGEQRETTPSATRAKPG